MNKNLGYYTCNGIEFKNKVNALIYSSTVKKPVEWIFNQDTFQKYTWQIEPTQSLDSLYDARARQLREKYDYIILSFSGGADTNNILDSFVRQNLHIDEIVINHMTSVTSSTTTLSPEVKHSWNFAAEHQLQAIPRLRYIHNIAPNTKITELDVSQLVVNGLKQFNDVDWVLNHNDHLSVGQMFRYNYFYFSELKKQFDKGKKIAIIVGIDKPRTDIIDNNFYISFIDTVANITTINDFNDDYENIVTELFYWSAESADILCKQSHVIKRWLELNPLKKKFWISPSYSTIRLYHERWLRSLLYSGWDDSWFQADKSTNWWNTEFDSWFRKDPQFSKEFKLWQHGIGFLAAKIPEYVTYNNYGQADKLKVFKNQYLIGTMK